MRRRVLLMISSMRGGGSEQQTRLLLQHLDRQRFEPHLYLTHRQGELLSRLPDDVPIHSFDQLPPQGGIYFPGRVLRRQVHHLRELLRREAIDVVYDRTFHMTMIAGAATRALGIPRMSTIVSPPEHALPLVEKRFVSWKRRRLATAYRHSRQVVAVSGQAADSAARYYRLDRDRIAVIPNPVDVDAVRAAATEPLPDPNWGRQQATWNLICVGRMTAEKGHQDLLDALDQTELNWPADRPPIRLQLVGDGPLRPALQQLWNSHLHRHRVDFLGAVSNPAPLIQAADALILPSHFEGLPNVVLEAMALQRPVIATRSGGTIELERDESTIEWAQPRDPASLAQAILALVNDPTGAQRRVDAAARMIQQYHDVQSATRQIEALLEE